MSAISKEEFEAALDGARTGMLFGVEDAIRAFFAALPGDVKLMRAVPTFEMEMACAGRPLNPTEYFRAMHDAAPPSLPD